MFTRAFWVATGERAVRAAAAALISLWVVGDGVLDAFAIDWAEAGGVALGAGLVSILLSLVASGVTHTPGPSLTGAETTNPRPQAPYTGGM